MEPSSITADLEPPRVTVDAAKARLVQGEPLLFLDVRNPKAWETANVKLPGALRLPVGAVEQHVPELPRDRTIIPYCTCPHEASSARAAQILSHHGFTEVHPLAGGFDAWQRAGYPVEPK
jgi:rhodanese-related sulfurtransferase